MLLKALRIIITLFGLLIGYQWTQELMPTLITLLGFEQTGLILTGGSVIGAFFIGLIFYLITPIILRRITYLVDFIDVHFQKIPTQDMLIGSLGMVSGLIIANLLTFALLKIPLVGSYLPIIANVLLGYLGASIAWKKRDELAQMLSLPKTKQSASSGTNAAIKVLDTSAIIDGRIADICSTGFIEGIIGIPTFVLHELQHIADSADPLRRNRGRRGLDVLNRMQKELGAQIQIFNHDFDDIAEVDAKLVRLAQTLQGVVVTNDYNLNKVCELQGVPVLNMNELANAVKPVVLPGEEMDVQIIKEGKEPGQGVGYLEDGTMIVVDEGRRRIGDQVKVIVTSVLQTAAGRMIFARLDK